MTMTVPPGVICSTHYNQLDNTIKEVAPPVPGKSYHIKGIFIAVGYVEAGGAGLVQANFRLRTTADADFWRYTVLFNSLAPDYVEYLNRPMGFGGIDLRLPVGQGIRALQLASPASSGGAPVKAASFDITLYGGLE